MIFYDDHVAEALLIFNELIGEILHHRCPYSTVSVDNIAAFKKELSRMD